VLDFAKIIEVRRLLRRQLEVLLLDPLLVLAGSRLGPLRRAPTLSKKHLLQPMPRTNLVLLRHPHRCQFAAPVAASKLDGIAPVCLDSIAGLHRH
jgi:hypothetical protein